MLLWKIRYIKNFDAVSLNHFFSLSHITSIFHLLRLLLHLSLGIFIHPSLRPALMCHQAAVYERAAFQFPHSSLTLLLHHPAIRYSVLKAQSMMTLLSNTFSPLICFQLDPSIRRLARSFIFSQNPAVSASVSEPSPPQTGRPRFLAPRMGSELPDRRRKERM